jgi:hypothetical protein
MPRLSLITRFPSERAAMRQFVALRSYLVYLRDASGSVARTHQIEAGSDEHARELVVLMLNEQIAYPSAEVWDRGRLVCVVRKGE